jgi:predicted GNAT superfamily acetyltransferase
MTSSATEAPEIVIRDIERVSEMRDVETIQKDIWGCDDLDVVPVTLLIASREVGGILVGAYDAGSLVGFVYGFPGNEHGQAVHHSHMLAVRRSHRNLNLGYKLKLAQRERVLAQGLKRITWTFDPLQSLNAHFNFSKLGVLCDQYKVNFYGETTSSFLHQVGTDRLWVTWLVDSERVRQRLNSETEDREPPHVSTLVQVRNDRPVGFESSEIFGKQQIAIEIPGNINTLQDNDVELALRWRDSTRWAFTTALASGYMVEDFYRASRDGQALGVYLLRQHSDISDFE